MTDKQMTTQPVGTADQIAPATAGRKVAPAVDIYETDENLVLLADLPGVKESDLQLQVSGGVLTLEAASTSNGNSQRLNFFREFKISDRIDADAGDASLRDGVLTLRLPKVEEAKARNITVKTLH